MLTKKQTNIGQQLKWVLHMQFTYYCWICGVETLSEVYSGRKDDGWCIYRRPVALMSLFFHSSRKQLYQQHHFPCLCLRMPSSTSSSDPLYNGWTVNDIKQVWRHLLRKLVSDRLPKHHNVMSNDQFHTKSAPVKTLQMTKNLHMMPVASSVINLIRQNLIIKV